MFFSLKIYIFTVFFLEKKERKNLIGIYFISFIIQYFVVYKIFFIWEKMLHGNLQKVLFFQK